MCSKMKIYNSRNYSILLNTTQTIVDLQQSTTVEIILYYLTDKSKCTVKDLQQ